MRTRMLWDTPDAHSTIGFLHAINAAAHHQMERAHNMTERRQASRPWHSSIAKEKAVQMTADAPKHLQLLAIQQACMTPNLISEGLVGSVRCDLGAESVRYMLPKHCQSKNDCNCLGRSALSRCWSHLTTKQLTAKHALLWVALPKHCYSR